MNAYPLTFHLLLSTFLLTPFCLIWPLIIRSFDKKHQQITSRICVVFFFSSYFDKVHHKQLILFYGKQAVIIYLKSRFLILFCFPYNFYILCSYSFLYNACRKFILFDMTRLIFTLKKSSQHYFNCSFSDFLFDSHFWTNCPEVISYSSCSAWLSFSNLWIIFWIAFFLNLLIVCSDIPSVMIALYGFLSI